MGSSNSKSKTKQTPIKKGGEITPIDRATLDLKISRDKLSKYRKKLALDSDKLATRAKALHAEGKTKNALQLMRLRKYKLAEADRVEEQLLTVLQMVDKISEKQNEAEVILAMKSGKNALQMMHDKMGIDNVLDLMDDIRDQNETEQRINEVLGQEGLMVMEELGEEDILAELEQLEEEVRQEKGQQQQKKEEDVVLPTVPQKPLPSVQQQSTTSVSNDETKVAVAS